MNAVVSHIPEPIEANAPMQMLRDAIAQNVDTDRLKALMDLQDRWEANEARKAFTSAMAAFKADPPTILKSKRVDIPGGAKFAHATLADVCDGVCASLGKYGLSHKWETKQDGSAITVTCIITHVKGHTERTVLTAQPDDSGKKNSIQQIASTVTYLERYTLMAATGLAAKDMDDDGKGAGKQKAAETAPEGYANWRADMGALADEGSEKLQQCWGSSKPEYRRHVIKFDEQWWNDTKAKASKVKAP